jgi:hypothetical protein
MAREEMLIFTRSFDLLSWLLPACGSMPSREREKVSGPWTWIRAGTFCFDGRNCSDVSYEDYH